MLVLARLFVFFMMEQNEFLLYGAYGYTGELIARYTIAGPDNPLNEVLQQYSLTPVLAGRREDALKPLAEKLSVPYKVIDLNDEVALIDALQRVKVVVHAAGPYHLTAKQMIDACLKTGTHYIDLNGDMEVFEMLESYHAAATASNIMILPGAGFDVVPTDCVALSLKKLLPDATDLKIAFATPGGGMSKGTAVTTGLKLGQPGAVRKAGQIVARPVGENGRWIKFFRGTSKADKKFFVMSIPWGDVFTAYHTTGIPNIETFTGISPLTYLFVKVQRLFNWLLRKPFLQKIITKKMHKGAAGPADEQRTKATAVVWAQATNPSGKTATVRLSCPDAYTLTAYTAILITQKILQGNFKPGYQTPAAVYGENLVMEAPGVERKIEE
jgi:short subunit dehydrogenase-like uncharacterized protein